MSNIIIPGEYGYGTRGFTPTDEGYHNAADALVDMYSSGRYVNEYDSEVRRVLDYHNASSLDELKVQRRGR